MKIRNALLALLLVLVTTASAEARRHRTMGGERYVANGTFGLGLELGAPFGLNGKYFLSDDRALNFGIGALYDNYYYDHDGLHLYLDYLFHPFSLTNQPAFQLPFFVGVGGRLWTFNGNNRIVNDDGTAFGIRVPVGLAFDFNNTPIDIFVQLTFVVDFYVNYRDTLGPHIEGSLGVRYWFN